MIDWPARIKEMKENAEELDLWASRSKDRQKLVLGRIADELRRFAADIERALHDPDEKRLQQIVPDWLADDIDTLYEEGVIEDTEVWVEDQYDEDENDNGQYDQESNDYG